MERTLRITYRLNAAATLACAAVLVAGGHLLAPAFAVPAPALWGTGAFFAVFGAWVWGVSRRRRLSWTEALVVGLLDGAYALASFAAAAAFGGQMTIALLAAVVLVAAPVAVASAIELVSAFRLRGLEPAAE
ncbi:MAG TPA: hypothetical protein VKE22_06440 [Haliangiales bacterium]|nr:hypothetical protein [Haliangiales bacterium]